MQPFAITSFHYSTIMLLVPCRCENDTALHHAGSVAVAELLLDRDPDLIKVVPNV